MMRDIHKIATLRKILRDKLDLLQEIVPLIPPYFDDGAKLIPLTDSECDEILEALLTEYEK